MYSWLLDHDLAFVTEGCIGLRDRPGHADMGSVIETCDKTSISIVLYVHVLEHFPGLARHTYIARVYKITAMTIRSAAQTVLIAVLMYLY